MPDSFPSLLSVPESSPSQTLRLKPLRREPRIALINPDLPDGRGFLCHNEGRFKRFLANPSMTMPYIAALTPPDVEVIIWDETLGDEILYDMDVDLVGITTVTQVARRAYDIAERFLARGVPVVLGGSHPTLAPAEAKRHASAVVVGEAEGAWPELVEDLRRGRLEPYYNRTGLHDLSNLPLPRWDLLGHRYRFMRHRLGQIKLSRGCPHSCSTCSIVPLYGGKFRYRPVRDVIAEAEQVDEEVLYFCEDNIVGNHPYAKQLFRELIPLNKNWASISTTTLAMDDELLSLAQRSGCKGIYYGVENPSLESLREMNKLHNMKANLADLVRKTQDNGIVVTGGFLVGFDNDTPEVFKRIIDFIYLCNLDIAQFYIIVPFPRTKYYLKLKREGRLFSESWWLDDFHSQEVLYQPAQMSVEQLREGLLSMTRETYSWAGMSQRILGNVPMRGISAKQLIGNIALNLGYREVYREQQRVYDEAPPRISTAPAHAPAAAAR